MTFWILLSIAGFFTLLASRANNFVYPVIASLGWWTVWGYNLNNPPAGITVGTFIYDLLYYTFILISIGVFFLYFRNRNRLSASQGRTAREQADYDREYKEYSTAPLSDDEAYRRQIRARIALGRARIANRRRR